MSADKMLKRPYTINQYNPAWVVEFNEIKDDIIATFGNKILCVEHVGSTSVPGMDAKHCIDVLVTVEKMLPFMEEKRIMETLGYKWADNYINPDTLIFWKETDDLQKTTNIHVCEKGSYDEEQFIVGRDYLRAHPEKVEEYNNLKRKLNAEYPDDYPTYRAGKQDFLKEMKELAIKWKKSI